MQVRPLAVTGVVTVASWAALGLSAPAFALCESYSGGCPSTPPAAGSGIGGNDEQRATGDRPLPVVRGSDQQPGSGDDEQPVSGVDDAAGTTTGEGGTGSEGRFEGTGSGAATVVTPTDTPTTLPFTGGELVLLTAAGAGALAGGTALVLAGRRRQATA